MHDPQLRRQPLHILPHIALQPIQIYTILLQHMQRLFLETEPLPGPGTSRPHSRSSRLLPIRLEALHHLPQILARKIRHAVQSRRLEILKARVVEDLAHRPLERRAVEAGRHQGSCLGDDDGAYVLLDEGLRFVFLELVLVRLALDLHLLDQPDFRADPTGVLHLSHVRVHSSGQRAFVRSVAVAGENAQPFFGLREDLSLGVRRPSPAVAEVGDGGEGVVVVR